MSCELGMLAVHVQRAATNDLDLPPAQNDQETPFGHAELLDDCHVASASRGPPGELGFGGPQKSSTLRSGDSFSSLIVGYIPVYISR